MRSYPRPIALHLLRQGTGARGCRRDAEDMGDAGLAHRERQGIGSARPVPRKGPPWCPAIPGRARRRLYNNVTRALFYRDVVSRPRAAMATRAPAARWPR
jgi:hypothetical protein